MPAAAVFGCSGRRLTPDERAFFADADPWGFILFARNVGDPVQLAALVGELRSVVGRRAAVLVDQEGGRVARLGPPFWPAWEPPAVAAAGAGAAGRLQARYRRIGGDLAALGIDINCAPALDLPPRLDDGIIGDRALGRDPGPVAELGRAVCRGLLAGGVVPVLKHMPGHGSAEQDSHAELPVSDASRAALEGRDFRPFRALADMPAAMTAHVAFAGIDPGVPATQSPTVIGDVIRGWIGFDGLLFSDDLCMQALAGAPPLRAERALAAGCDMAVQCDGDLDGMIRAMTAIPPLAGAAARRAARVDALRRQLAAGATEGTRQLAAGASEATGTEAAIDAD